MSEAITTARPYAQAAFDEAQKLNDLKGWSEVLLAGATAVDNAEVAMVIASPRATGKQVEDIMRALCGVKSGSKQDNFIRLLAENRRLALFPEIAAMYEALRAEAEKSLEVTVTSAFELNDAQKQKITDVLNKRMNRKITLNCRTDKQLLGGIVIRAGDKVIDGSVRTRLGEMANALA
ncbi:MAG TPA: F0F1 ATP synthase subunit delta [Gallionellaceae bacterium]|nr:F0F1 ATP synthase subunit delta [Gallionellaceae bacterium]